MADIAGNYRHVKEVVSGLNPDALLICVSKTKPASDLRVAFEAGCRDFGENYVDELIEKAPQLPEANFHLIGHLQTNKINKIINIPNLVMIHTVDSERLAEKINSKLPVERDHMDVLVQVNTSSEEQKSGVEPGPRVTELVRFIQEKCPRLRFCGLMTIGAYGDGTKDFAKLSAERERLAQDLGVAPESMQLSMGMSSDYEIALQMGSTMVRVGSTIFGPRIYKNK